MGPVFIECRHITNIQLQVIKNAMEMIAKMKEIVISDECQRLIQDIESAHQSLSSLSATEILKRSEFLCEYRKKSSSTLQQQSGRDDTWLKANQFISEQISENIEPNWEHIIHLNQIFEPVNGGRLRISKIYIGKHEAPDPKELSHLIEMFQQKVLKLEPTTHPLLTACRVRYWLVTIHPFIDGNGRTSNLLCDWILALHGYPPLTYRLKVDSHIGGWGGRSHFSTFDYACAKTLQSLKYTYALLLQSLSDSVNMNHY